jgi:chaperonin GroES
MATQFPIEQGYGQEIEGIPGMPQENEDGSVEVELELDDSNIEELPDGSAVVSLNEDLKGPSDDEDFYSNLADGAVEKFDLDTIATRYIDLIEKDRNARELRDKQYEEGLRRTGMGKDAPGGATFSGASKVVHPVMAEACVDFAARAIKELFPPSGPARTKIVGDSDKEKLAIAQRKRDYINWQLTEQIEEFRDEQEQMLTQLPLGGSQFMKLWYDEDKKRPCAEFVPIDNILLPFSAANFYTAQRVTEQNDITEWEYKRRVAQGLYIDTDFVRATMDPVETKAEKANDKIEGRKREADNVDGERRVYHVYTWLEIEDDDRTKGKMAPYILMIDELESEVIGLYRNWEEGDETLTKLDWLIEFKFIPWRGAYAVGLPHLIGGLAAGLTGGIRALLDSAHINNAATMLKLKGAKISGQSQQVEVTQVAEIEGAPGVDDIRKIAMPMPFNPPSQVLFELVGYLDKSARGVVSTAQEKIADVNANAPVGTTQALIEQGAVVFSAIHARLHDAQGRLFKVLGRLNRWYLEDQRKGEVVAELDIRKEDFNRNTDVIPVSDPNIFSETQRMAQIQAVMAVMDKNPDLFDRKAVIERFLTQIKVPEVNELMKDVPAPEKRDAANENVAMALGKPAFAYIEQDHLAHLQSHLDFAKDPVLGANPLMAPAFLPNVMEHIKQHLTMWYLNRMNGYVLKSSGNEIKDYDQPAITGKVDKLFAVAAQHVNMDTNEVFQGVMPLIQNMIQEIQKYKPQPPLTPEAMVLERTSMAETQRRAAKDQADLQLAQAKQQQDVDLKMEDLRLRLAIAEGDQETRKEIEAARLERDAAKLRLDEGKAALTFATKGGPYGYQ